MRRADRDVPAYAPSGPWDSEHGLTLTELTIVGALATMVMLALTVFYFNSQTVWIAGSTQAMAQRDGTLLVEALRYQVHAAEAASVDAISDPLHHQLSLSFPSGKPPIEFRWNSTDHKVHMWVGGNDKGSIVETPVTRINFSTRGADIVELTLLELRTANGDTVRTGSRFALLGR